MDPCPAAAPAAPQTEPDTSQHHASTLDYAAAIAHAVEATIDGVAEVLQGVSADLPSPMELEKGETRQHPAGDHAVDREREHGEAAPAGTHEDEFDWEQVGGCVGWGGVGWGAGGEGVWREGCGRGGREEGGRGTQEGGGRREGGGSCIALAA